MINMTFKDFLKKHKQLLLSAYLIFSAFLVYLTISQPIQFLIITLSFISVYFVIFAILVYIFYWEQDYTPINIKKYPKLSVLVSAFNDFPYLYGCLDSIVSSDYAGELEIIVITDGTFDLSKYTNIISIVKPKSFFATGKKTNLKSKALNQGLKKATGEFIAVVDADSFLKPGSLQIMINHFLNNQRLDKKLGAITSLVIPKNKDSILERIQYVEYAVYMGFLNYVLSKIDSILVTPGPLTIYKKSMLDKIGFFDESNITEDMELTWRIHKNGYTIEKYEDTVVETFVPKTLSQLVRQRTRWIRGKIQTVFKHFDMLFERKYADFGFFILPYFLFLEALGIFLFLKILGINGKNMLEIIHNVYNLIFVAHVVPSPELNPIVLGTSFYFGVLLSILSIIFTYIGTRIGQFKPRKIDLITIPLYFSVYSFFLTAIYLSCIVEEALGVDYKW